MFNILRENFLLKDNTSSYRNLSLLPVNSIPSIYISIIASLLLTFLKNMFGSALEFVKPISIIAPLNF